jgi:hypothetical protein
MVRAMGKGPGCLETRASRVHGAKGGYPLSRTHWDKCCAVRGFRTTPIYSAEPVRRGQHHEGQQAPGVVQQQPDACQRSAPTTELLAKVFKGRQSPPAALDALAIDFE